VFPSDLVEAGADLGGLQPIAGRFEIEDDAVWFVPRFPFVAGRSYALLVSSDLGDKRPEVWHIQRPAPAGVPTTEVTAMYPDADEVPLNLLKLYVHFSSPMSEGWAGRAVHVRRADDDQPLADVFLRMEPELWDPDRRRLTLLLDPGRIKRGLAPHEQVGYPLIEGVPVVVSVDATFRDAAGQPLRSETRSVPLRTGFERRYAVGPAIRARIDPAAWQLHLPAARSTEPLIVEFDRPLDHALLEHCLSVNDTAGVSVDGVGSADPGGRSWRFEPESPWKAGRYSLIVDSRLEDLAGNSLVRVFDRDLTRPADTPAEARPVAIDFVCA